MPRTSNGLVLISPCTTLFSTVLSLFASMAAMVLVTCLKSALKPTIKILGSSWKITLVKQILCSSSQMHATVNWRDHIQLSERLLQNSALQNYVQLVVHHLTLSGPTIKSWEEVWLDFMILMLQTLFCKFDYCFFWWYIVL